MGAEAGAAVVGAEVQSRRRGHRFSAKSEATQVRARLQQAGRARALASRASGTSYSMPEIVLPASILRTVCLCRSHFI